MIKKMKISEEILNIHQSEKFRETTKSKSYKSFVRNDVRKCENIILSVCDGRFPS
tara:strand:- start:382 stop:546 length:165 start_codon:yes stop_codon:yes gene_type:complete